MSSNPTTDSTANQDNSAMTDLYISQMWANYYACEDDIQTMQTSTNNIESDEEQENDKHCKKKEKKQLDDDIAYQQEQYNEAEADLEARDPGMDDLCDTMDSLLDSVESVNDQHTSRKDKQSDFESFSEDTDQLYTAMYDQLKADMYSDAIAGDTDGQLSNDQLLECSTMGMQYASSENVILNNLLNSMEEQYQDSSDEYNQASADKSKRSYSTSWMWGGVGEGVTGHHKSKEQKKMNNGLFMENSLVSAMTALEPALAQASPQFTELQFAFTDLIRHAQAIIDNDDLSPAEKQNQLLELMMIALGIFNLVKDAAEGEQSKNEQLMAESNLNASELNTDQIETDQELQANLAHHSVARKWEMRIAEATIGALMMLAAPGVGTMFMIAVMVALSESGVTEKATNALGNAMGSQIGADVLVATLEAVLTAGSSVGLDLVAEQVGAMLVEGVAETAAAAAQSSIEIISEDLATEIAEKLGDDAIEERANAAIEKILTKTAKKAAEDASKTVVEELFSQPLPTIIEKIVAGTFKQSLIDAVERASQEAVETALADVQEMLIRPVIDDAMIDATEEDMMNQIAALEENPLLKTLIQDSVVKAVADATQRDVEKVAKSAARTTAEQFGQRLAIMSLASVANTDLLEDMTRAILEKEGADMNSERAQILLNVMEIIEKIMEAIAMVGLAQISVGDMDETARTLKKAANGIQATQMLVNAIGGFEMFATTMKKAKIIEDMQMRNSLGEVLRMIGEQIHKDGQMQQRKFMQDLKAGMELQEMISTHLYDGDMEATRILVQAV